MTDQSNDAPKPAGPAVGSVGWIDLSVPDAPVLRDFYKAVVGFTSEGCDMGGYEDFNMIDAAGTPTAGICHARGTNENLPAAWLIYFIVADLDASLATCTERGGAVIAGPKSMGAARYAVLRDPAGAHVALYQP